MIATQLISNGAVATVKTCNDLESKNCITCVSDTNSSYVKFPIVTPGDNLTPVQREERYARVTRSILDLLFYAIARLPARKKERVCEHVNGWLRDLLKEGVEPNPGPLAFHFYGNYGGPGYTGGKFGGSDFSVKPIDDLDQLFRTHDFFYFNGLERTGDKVLIRQLNQLIPKLSGVAKEKAKIALFGFAAKYPFTKNSNKITACSGADDLFKLYNIVKKVVDTNITKSKIHHQEINTAKDFYSVLTGKGDYTPPAKKLVGVELNPGPPVKNVKKQLRKQGITKKSLSLVKAAVMPRQSGFGPIKKVKGKGDYISDLGKNLGGKLGSYLGGHAASLLGSVFGLGDYHTGSKVGSNSMLNGTSPPVLSQGDKQRAFIFKHREYVNDILSSQTFSNSSYLINTGLFRTFPWLAPIASAFEQYKIMGMLFEFKSLTSDISPNSSGSVIMSTEYNLTKPNYTSKIQMENAEYAVSCKPTISMLHAIECEPSEIPVNILDVRPGAVPTGQDPRFYDLANFQIATAGQTATQSVLGELWVTYEIAFFKPLFNSGLGLGLLTDKYHLTNPGYSNLMANAVLQPGSILGTTITSGSPSTITFPASVSTGNYLVILNQQQTASGASSGSNISVTNGDIITMWASPAAQDVQNNIGLAGNQQGFAWCMIVQVSAPGASQCTLSISLAGGNSPSGFGDVLITQINGSINT